MGCPEVSGVGVAVRWGRERGREGSGGGTGRGERESVLVDPRSVPLGLCSWVFVCVTVRRWGNEPLNKWEGVVWRGKELRKSFLLDF